MTLDDTEIARSRERFFEDTKNHRMEVLLNNGLYRHLRFKDPANGFYWFDLITTPYVLIFRGDGDAYVFSRRQDMFRFFASGIYKDGSLHINPHYWAEKLSSQRQAAMEYSKDVVWEQVKDRLHDMRDPDFPEETNVKLADRIEADWKERDSWGYLEDAEGARSFLSEWEDEGVWSDTWEWPMQGYDWWYLWACHGIVWGIQQYLKAGHALSPEQPESGSASPTGYNVAAMGRDVTSVGTEMVMA